MKLPLLLLGIATGIAVAQDSASLTGTVRDSSSAIIVGAAVTIRNEENGLVRGFVSNTSGEYLAASLPPGRYSITAAAPGFAKYEAHDVTLRVAQNARIDITLKVAGVEEHVAVQGAGLAQMSTQSSEVSGTITSKEITQLQLNGRNFTQLITLVPGVSNQTGQDEALVGKEGNVNFSINGGRTENNNWEVDGANIMDDGSNSSINVYPSLEAIEEVEVLTSNYGAQYGRNSSGTIEVETKSGTNQFHGGAYEFLRNDMFNARNYFDELPGAPPYKKNDFGYNLGGPIWKNHTFFFWSEEWRKEDVPQTFHTPTPSVANREGNFNDVCNVPNPTDCPHDPNTGLPYPNNQLPYIDPNGQALLKMISLPTAGSGADSFFDGAVGKPTHWREELFRIDHDLNSKMRLTFRSIHDSWDTTNPTVTYSGYNYPTIGTRFQGPGVSLVAKFTATISPTVINEFTGAYSSSRIIQNDTDPSVWQRPSTFTMTGLFPGFGGKLPDFCVQTQGAYQGGFCEGPSFFPWINSNPTYTYRDKVSVSRGKHNLQFGADFVASEKNEGAQTNRQGILVFDSTAPVSTGNAFADLLLGNIANYSQDSAEPKYYLRYKMFDPYLQDDFHVSKHLTLNLGLRVDLFGTFREIQKQVYNWEPGAFDPSKAPPIDVDGSVTGQAGALIPTPGTSPYNGLVQCGGPGIPPGCQKGHLFNPAPRIGFAWDPFGDGKTAIRGAYGIFYDHTNGEEGNAETLEGTPPLVQNTTQYNVAGYTNIGGQGILFPLTATTIPVRAIWPYVQQWHVDVQRSLPEHIVATLSYVGSKGTHLTLQREFNQLQAIPSSKNPFQPGQAITTDICNTQGGTATSPTFQVNGNTVGGQPAINLLIACGNDPDPFRPYYSMGSIQRLEPEANSIYNSLQFSLRKTTGALMLAVAYTYSHSLDDSSDKADSNFVDSYNLRGNYASSNFDQRQILTASWVYDLHFFKKPGLAHHILGGWQLAGIMTSQSGTPFSVVNGAFGDSAGVANGYGTGSYADVIGNPHALPASTRSSNPNIIGPLLYNAAAYILTQGLTFGDSGRNSLNLPHRTNVDMSVYKVFKPTERIGIQFRAEAFNVFNHTQFSSVDNYVGTDSFMYAGSAHSGRVLQLGLKLAF